MQSIVDQAIAQAWKGTKANPIRLNGALVYPQKNNWSCGPMTLRYCLMRYGLDVDELRIIDLSGATRAGTGEHSMQYAAFALGFDLRYTNVLTTREAKMLIDELLKKGRPVVLSVEKWQHWVACLGHTHRGYVILDSSRPGPVIQLHSWRWLRKRLRYVPRETGQVIYSFAGMTRRPVQRH